MKNGSDRTFRSPNRPEPHDLLSTMETWRRTDYTDRQETKLKLSIHTDVNLSGGLTDRPSSIAISTTTSLE